MIVLVKKYFDKANGNSYHSVQFDNNDKIYHSGKTYGYERQYEQTFQDLFLSIIDENKQHADDEQWWKDIKQIITNKLKKETKYIVIDNCKAKELKEIHEYK